MVRFCLMRDAVQIIRFADFEVDTRARELRRQGCKVNLQEQPLRTLVILLERRGELVTREELTKALWPEGTFVDFERGLNKVINKLRAALSDDVEKPRYIETIRQTGYRFIAPVATPRRICSVAVLPLENLSGDPSQEYFSDGMTEELICEIARIPSLRVISRTSAMLYKGSRKRLPVIAAELQVEAVVEGTVARLGDRVRITAQLIHAGEDRHLWSGRYEHHLHDILQLQSEVAHDIASRIQGIIDPDVGGAEPVGAKSPARRKPLPEAYDAYLKGNHFRDRLTPPDLEKSILYYTQSIDLDPEYAPAYGALARCYQFAAIFGLRHPVEAFFRVRTNAVRALELDDTVASAHVALAAVNVFDGWNWAAAVAESRRAVEISPGLAFTHGHYGDYLSIVGRHEEGIEAMRRALELDPISPEYNNWLALVLYRARRYDESIACAHKVLEIDPHHINVLWFLALAQEKKGDLTAAIGSLAKAAGVTNAPHYRALLCRVHALAGEVEKAQEIRHSLIAASRSAYVSPFDLAVADMGVGEHKSMFDHLEEACLQKTWRVIELLMPYFDSVRQDQRWADLVRRIGLSSAVGDVATG